MAISIDSDSFRCSSYAGEIAGRLRGVAKSTIIFATPELQSKVNDASLRIETSARTLLNAAVLRSNTQTLSLRIAIGTGRGVDFAFDTLVSAIGNEIREGSVNRTNTNEDYLTVFPEGETQPYTNPAIRSDFALVDTLLKRVRTTKAKRKDDIIARLEAIAPTIDSAVDALDQFEKQVEDLKVAEINARKALIDTIYVERKALETLLGREGRALVKLLFADFREASESRKEKEAPAPTPKP